MTIVLKFVKFITHDLKSEKTLKCSKEKKKLGFFFICLRYNKRTLFHIEFELNLSLLKKEKKKRKPLIVRIAP